MTMRDKIAQVLCETPTGHYGKQADAIIAALPDYDAQQARIAEIEAAILNARAMIDHVIHGEVSITSMQDIHSDLSKALKGEEA
jgi:hypothetical protein